MGTVYAVGIGPGGEEFITEEAKKTLEEVDIIAGYTVYVDLVKEIYPDKEFYTTSMKQEIERCRWALEKAEEGKNVAVVSSGDAGVYGMAGLLLELSEQHPDADVRIVSGITAALSGAAVLGAPIGHDFCLISLSDLLTPWELIEQRVKAAAEADFCICIYNPKSKKRSDLIDKACAIIEKIQGPDIVCGWVKNIGREGTESAVVRLNEIPDQPIDMFTTVFIGSTRTKEISGKMVTPRGYEKHEDRYFRGNN